MTAGVDVMVVTANLRRVLPQDRGRLAWPSRRARLVRLIRLHNPDVLLAQECDEAMFGYVADHTDMAVVKPTAGNRCVFYRKSMTLLGTRATDLGERDFAAAALLSMAGVPAWYVSTHLDPYKDALRARQLKALGAFVVDLARTAPVVVGADFSTEGRLDVATTIDVRSRVARVGHAGLASRHTWLRKRRKAAWVDRILITAGITPRWVQLVLTDDQESDHHWPAAGLTIKARP